MSDGLFAPDPPWRNDGVTIGRCRDCGNRFVRRGRRRYCSDACRQHAHRRRHAGAIPEMALRERPRAEVVYECPRCEGRQLGERRCPECNVFCRRVGPGGCCPHCDEPVALADLIVPGG